MFLEIELLYFVLMIGVFVLLLLLFKLPSGICLMISAVVGAIVSCIFSGTALDIRYFVEGMFGYFDTILVIITAMVFMEAMQSSGALEYISVLLVKAFRKVPSILLICLIIIIMFPAMVTGSSLASAITTGALVAPIMIKWGIPKSKVGAIVAVGSILGMIAPPVNVPAMVICDVVDIPFVGFTLPLLMLAIPMAIICVLLLGRKYVKSMTLAEVEMVVDTKILKELNWTVCIPMLVLIALILGELLFPAIFGALGMSAMFVFSTILACCLGRKRPLFAKNGKTTMQALFEDYKTDKPASSIYEVLSVGIHKSFSAIGLLMGVGMFMEIITLNGVRGYFATNAVALAYTLPAPWGKIIGYVSMALTLPIFGGISAFGSASVLGGPFVMMLNGVADNIIVTCGLSLLAAIGEFLPPTAMSATFGAHVSGKKSWKSVTAAALPAILVMFVYALLYAIVFGQLVQQDAGNSMLYILFGVTIAVAIVFAVVYEIMVNKFNFLKKHVHVCGTPLPQEKGDKEEAIVENILEEKNSENSEVENILEQEGAENAEIEISEEISKENIVEPSSDNKKEKGE